MEPQVEVHLQALADFAWVLEGQSQALRPPADRLAALAPAALPLGEFVQARELSERCQAAAREMQALLEKLRQAVGFADAITRAVAQGYVVYDEMIADEIRRTGAGGNVYYSSQYNIGR
jgi:predicted nucleic acid-binding protein